MYCNRTHAGIGSMIIHNGVLYSSAIFMLYKENGFVLSFWNTDHYYNKKPVAGSNRLSINKLLKTYLLSFGVSISSVMCGLTPYSVSCTLRAWPSVVPWLPIL